MIEIASLMTLISRPRYIGGGFHSTRLHWQRDETVGLLLLTQNKIPVENAAEALGRSPSSIAHRAIDTGLKLPSDWRDLVRPKRLCEEPREPLQYPFVAAVRGEHADLLAVNSLVPRGMPDHQRADICQEIMLALWEGTCTLDELKKDKGLLRKFTREFRANNFEGGGYALSLDAPMQDGRSWYDVLPDNRVRR